MHDLVLHLRFYVGFSLVFVFVCHGTGAIFVLLTMALNYTVATRLAGHWSCPHLTWAFNLFVLAHSHGGLRFGHVFGEWFGWLDHESMRGLLPAWQEIFRLCTLRMISFNVDRFLPFFSIFLL